MPRLLAIMLIVAFAGWASTGRVSAQDTGARFRLAPELAAVADPALTATPAWSVDARSHSLVRSGRAMRAAGIGLMLGSAIGLALSAHALHGPDRSFSRAGLITSGLVMGVGIAFTFGGSLRVARVRSAAARDEDRSGWLPLIGLATALTALGLAVGAAWPESIPDNGIGGD
jgi:hypothetical protein